MNMITFIINTIYYLIFYYKEKPNLQEKILDIPYFCILSLKNFSQLNLIEVDFCFYLELLHKNSRSKEIFKGLYW